MAIGPVSTHSTTDQRVLASTTIKTGLQHLQVPSSLSTASVEDDSTQGLTVGIAGDTVDLIFIDIDIVRMRLSVGKVFLLRMHVHH
jgi:hypothetical protein